MPCEANGYGYGVARSLDVRRHDSNRNAVERTAEPIRPDGESIPFPIGADGTTIKVGDMVKDPEGKVGRVIYMHTSVSVDAPEPLWHMNVKEKPSGSVRFGCDPSKYVHAPATVEDVLEQFVARWMDTHHDDLPALKAEYAAKLQLREE